MNRSVCGALVALVLAGALAAPLGAQRAPEPPLDELLGRAGRYLDDYAKSFATVVAEEKYVQVLQWRNAPIPVAGLTERQTGGLPSPVSADRRELRADMVAVTDTDQTWLSFRDVFAVDGKNVRDRDERLQRLFLDGKTDAVDKARAIADEGARFNIGSIQRNVNFPTMALTFLQARNQPRSSFKRAGGSKVAGVETLAVTFDERVRPTIVRSAAEDLPVHGKFWIEPASGRVMKTEVSFDGRFFSGEVTVTYGLADKLKLWLPMQMEETCSNANQSVSGKATYTNFRRFGVSTEVVIK